MTKSLIFSVFCLLGAAGGALGACPSPNPNISAPPFVDGCPLPASGLNNLANSIANLDASVATKITGSGVPTYVPVWTGSASLGDGTPTGIFWPSGGANVLNRAGDRLFLGKTTNKYDGSNGNCVSNCTWVGDPAINAGIFRYLENNGQLLSYSQNGEMGSFFASRTSDNGTQGCCSMGVATLQFNDNTTTVQASWGGYHTAVRAPGAGTITDSEWDIGNLGTVVPINSYHMFPVGLTADLWVFCGGELAATSYASSLHACSAAMGIGNNGAAFDKGIVFDANGLTSHGGDLYAINLPAASMIRWTIDNTDTTTSWVQSFVDTTADAIGLTFQDGGAIFYNGSKTVLAAISGNTAVPSSLMPYVTLAADPSLSEAQIRTGASNGAINGNLALMALGNGTIKLETGTNLLVQNVAGGVAAQVASGPFLTGSSYVELSNVANDALIAPGTLNGASTANLQLQALGSGSVVVNSPLNAKVSGQSVLVVSTSTPISGNTGIAVLYNNGTSTALHNVSVGAPNSGGTGFRALVVPN
jgi:hypothetical protein